MNRPVPSQPLNKYRQNPMMNQSPIPPNGTVFPGQAQQGMPQGQPGMLQPGMPQQGMPQQRQQRPRQNIAPSPGMPSKRGTQPIIENPRMAQQQQARPQGQAQGQAQDNPQMKKFIENAMQAGHHPNEIMQFIGSKFGMK